MEDLWREVFSVGTEWEAMEGVYDKKTWDFSNLEKAFEEGGELYQKEKNVYLFGCTETLGIADASLVPIIVAVVRRSPPSTDIGIASVQRKQDVMPMRKLKMDWVPYIPAQDKGRRIEAVKSRIFVLKCKQRKVGLKHLNFDRLSLYNYCMPYYNNPLKEDEFENSTDVNGIFERSPPLPPLPFSFDWEMDDLEEFTSDLIQNEALGGDEKDKFIAFVNEKVAEAKKKQADAKKEKGEKLEEMSEEEKDDYRNMKLYKFYPVMPSDGPQLLKCRGINRYYDKADQVL
ncbi:OLC1v1033053C1 [Oldenlandia corymbosa var. corymbosa]|uniref:OLC1v1033053C1 n=1 Tax=Oldenlandia corymbosa var. corymbosa TaxID=529605 RepID=A0AAV1CNV0_OLDCO|nr:OLC1v1033053C1 [Oldenlandia corymbosa var. corymbosa]